MHRIRHILGFLAIAAFAVRSLMPAGFMLEVAHGKTTSLLGLEVVICTGHAPNTHTDATHVPSSPQPKKSGTSSDLCPYAAAGTTGNVASAPDTLETTVRYAEVVYALTAQVFAATPLPGPLSARGPPAIT